MDYKEPVIGWESRIVFHDLHISSFEMENEFVVGRKEIGVYINVPGIAVESIQLLNEQSVGEVETFLHNKYGEEVGVLDFVTQCVELGFVKMVNDQALEFNVASQKVKNQFPWITQRFSRLFFNKIAWTVYALLFVYCCILYFKSPISLPKPIDFIWNDSLTIVVVLGMASMWSMIFVHEMGHLLAARANGVDASIHFGYQQIYMVIETILPDIWTVERKRRIEVYLAGMAFNVIMLSISLTFVVLADRNVVQLAQGVYRFLKFVNIINDWVFVTQVMVFVKSDLYYVLNDLFRCIDLNGNAAILVKQKLGRKLRFDDEQKLEAISSHERKYVSYYIPFYLFGVVFSATIAIGYLGLSGQYIVHSVERMTGLSIASLKFWDEFFSSGYLILPVVWLLVYLIRDLFRKRATRHVEAINKERGA